MCRQRRRLQLLPRVVLPKGGTERCRWRNGLQQRHWQVVTIALRADRVSFLSTLRRPPLVPPLVRFG